MHHDRETLSARSTPFSPALLLGEACQSYLARRANKLTSRSHEMYRYYFRSLQRFFTPTKQLLTFHEGHFREYQTWRASGGARASVINHELNALAQLLRLADLWHPISRYYECLPVKNWVPPQVMSQEEEARFLRFGRHKPEWKTAVNVALITGNTTLAGCELRTLRLEHLRLKQEPPVILVPESVKNRHRVRGVPLNDAALAAVNELVMLAEKKGSRELKHYLIPFRVKKGSYDPTRPGSPWFIRSSFRSIANTSGLSWVTPSTFRHQAITKLLESGAPDETVRAIAGHVTEKAMKYYSHIRIGAKKAAVDLLGSGPRGHKLPTSVGHGEFFTLLDGLKREARRLGISDDAALELVLYYERSKLPTK
jgi:integrase